MSITTKLGLADFDPSTAGTTAIKQLARVLDGMIHTSIISDVFDSPSDALASIGPGKVYIVSGTPGGAWAGHANEIVICNELVTTASATHIVANFEFVTPIEGFILWKETLGGHRITFNDSGWMSPGNVPNTSGEDLPTTLSRYITFLDLLRAHGVIAT